MYKCKECGLEFEEKPDYCDCGNDEFEPVEIVNESEQKIDSNKVEEKENTTVKETLKPIFSEQSVNQKTGYDIPQKTFSEQYPEISRISRSFDPISLTIFLICIVLSIYVTFFAWNKTEDENAPKTTSSQKQEQIKNIPSIDKFWNDTPPVPQKNDIKKPEPAETVSQTQKAPILPAMRDIKVPIKENKTVQPKVTKVPLKKVNNSVKTVSSSQKKQNEANLSQQKKEAEVLAKKKAEQELAAKKAREAELKKAEEEQIKKLKAEQVKKEASSKQEFETYKAKLRNTIGSKIDFARVIGDGDCAVTFKLSSDGRLINRSFAKQSSNLTLNDAVYNAVMSTPSFTSPPSVYKNETLILSIRFYNGNFEISLK